MEAERSTDEVRVPVGTATSEIRDRGSRFFALVKPATTADEARDVRDQERGRNHDATHHVWAFRGASGAERWDDDGEPAGTGGRPILSAIDAAGLADVVVVVTRWYGGTKLGTGGLARAYGRAAGVALESVQSISVRPGQVVRIRYDWPDTGAVAAVVEASDAHRLAERFDPDPELEVAVPSASVGELIGALRDATGGRAVCSLEERSLWVRHKA